MSIFKKFFRIYFIFRAIIEPLNIFGGKNMPTVYPRKTIDKIDWLRVFKNHYALIYTDFNFSNDSVTKVEKACETIIYSIRLADRAKKYSKACTAFRDTILKKKSRLAQTVPQLNEIEPPAELFTADALSYIEEVIRLIKAQSNYTSATGELLGIEKPKTADALDTAKPKLKLIALINSVVRINWKKGKAQGVMVESKRGTEENFTEIGRDQYSPFIDARPPLKHGKPELRFYRLTYLMHDKPVGITSEIYTITTNP